MKDDSKNTVEDLPIHVSVAMLASVVGCSPLTYRRRYLSHPNHPPRVEGAPWDLFYRDATLDWLMNGTKTKQGK